MKIKEVWFNKYAGQITALIDGKTDEYFILWDSLGFSCTCPDNSIRHIDDYNYKCKHIKKLLRDISGYININELDKIDEVDKKMVFLRTGKKCIDELFGGLPRGILFGLVGEPESGKTTLLFELLFDIAFKEDGDVLIIDGEGGFFEYVSKYWLNIFNHKYGLKDNDEIGLDEWVIDNYEEWLKKASGGRLSKVGNIKFKHLNNSNKKRKIHILSLLSDDGVEPVAKLNLLIGKPSVFKISEGGKISLKPHPAQAIFSNAKKTPLAQFIIKHGIIGIGLDSLTMVVDTKYSGETEAFPARAKNNMQINNQLQLITSAFDLYTIVNHHATINPTSGKYAIPKMTGNKGTRHNFKFQALIMIVGSTMGRPHPSQRWMRILRSQTRPRSSTKTGGKMKFEITSNGIIDIESIENLKEEK